jgi:hypothetical protein
VVSDKIKTDHNSASEPFSAAFFPPPVSVDSGSASSFDSASALAAVMGQAVLGTLDGSCMGVATYHEKFVADAGDGAQSNCLEILRWKDTIVPKDPLVPKGTLIPYRVSFLFSASILDPNICDIAVREHDAEAFLSVLTPTGGLFVLNIVQPLCGSATVLKTDIVDLAVGAKYPVDATLLIASLAFANFAVLSETADTEVTDTYKFNLDPIIPGSTYTTDSGVTYFTPSEVGVPEPNTLVLLASGLTVIICALTHRRKPHYLAAAP